MVRSYYLLACCVLAAALVVPATAYPSPVNYYRDDGPYDQEELVDILNRLGNLIQMERKMEKFVGGQATCLPAEETDIKFDNRGNYLIKHRSNITLLPDTDVMKKDYKDGITSEKRALDLGLSRGYSGALQAKHLMGLAAANYAGGPGRRRRDAH